MEMRSQGMEQRVMAINRKLEKGLRDLKGRDTLKQNLTLWAAALESCIQIPTASPRPCKVTFKDLTNFIACFILITFFFCKTWEVPQIHSIYTHCADFETHTLVPAIDLDI